MELRLKHEFDESKIPCITVDVAWVAGLVLIWSWSLGWHMGYFTHTYTHILQALGFTLFVFSHNARKAPEWLQHRLFLSLGRIGA